MDRLLAQPYYETVPMRSGRNKVPGGVERWMTANVR